MVFIESSFKRGDTTAWGRPKFPHHATAAGSAVICTENVARRSIAKVALFQSSINLMMVF